LPNEDNGKNQAVNIVNHLKDLHAEFAQLSELQEMERTHLENLLDVLKFLFSKVGATVPVSVEALGNSFADVKKAYLASEAIILVVDSNGNITSQQLIQLPPKNILDVIADCSPKLKEMIAERRDMVSERVGLLEKVMKELKKAKAVLKAPAQQELEELDIVRNSITSE